MTTVFADNCPAMVTSASEKVRQRSLGSIPKTVISGRPSSSSPTLTSFTGQSILLSSPSSRTFGRTDAKS